MIIMRCCLCFCSKSQNYRVSNFTPEERNVLTTFLQKLENTGNDFRENSGDIKQYKTGVKALIKNFESDNNPKITLSRKQKNNLLRILQILHKHSDNKEKPNFDTVINSKLELLVFLSSKTSDNVEIKAGRIRAMPMDKITLNNFFTDDNIQRISQNLSGQGINDILQELLNSATPAAATPAASAADPAADPAAAPAQQKAIKEIRVFFDAKIGRAHV